MVCCERGTRASIEVRTAGTSHTFNTPEARCGFSSPRLFKAMNRPQLQSDFSRPAGLPTASLHRNLGPIQHEDVSSEAYLLQQEEEWNRKIDDQVDTLQRNMEELIELAKVRSKATTLLAF